MKARLRALAGPIGTPLLALAASLVIGSFVMLLSGVAPGEAYASLLKGAVGSPQALGRTLSNATPLILTGLAVAFAFRGGLFNIGADGQFIAGAVTAAWLGVSLPVTGVAGVIVVLLAAAAAGFVVGGLAGLLKARFGAHEVVTTIMLNFIVANLATWLLLNPLSGRTQVPGSADVDESRTLPALGGLPGVHAGLGVALLAVVVATVVLFRTARGLEIRVAGLSARAARYSGVRPVAAAVLALGGGGAFAGLAGAGEVLGTYGNMTVPFVTNLGFLGIGVALLGRNHPVGCVVGGLILGGLSAGGQQMQFDLGISSRFTEVLVAVVLLFITMRTIEFGGLRNRLSGRIARRREA